VPDDTITIPRRVETASGGLTYEFPVAGLASWLCLKSDAIMRRDKPKDSYDIVWVLDALDPYTASERWQPAPCSAARSPTKCAPSSGSSSRTSSETKPQLARRHTPPF